MFESREHFDLGDMKLEQFKKSKNKKVVGKFKDETQGIQICEFIGLRSKIYSIKLDDDSEKKTAKGIVRNVIKKHLKHEQYKNILETGDRMNSSMKMIRSFDHNIYTVNVNKVSLSAYDNKRFIRNDGISSYAYGHNAIISSAMLDGDIGANAMDVNLGASVKDVDTVDDDDAWLYIPYDN